MAAPLSRNWPRLTWRMPSRPANGARMVFLARTARRLSTCARVCLACASAASASAAETRFLARMVRARSRLARARSALAAADRSWACSMAVSSSTSTSPALTVAPDSNAMVLTVPETSALTMTPWTAVTEPMAVRVGCQRSAFTSAVVTVSGGGTNWAPCAAIVWNCSSLRPASAPPRSSRPTTVRMIFFVMSLLYATIGSGFPAGRAIGVASIHPLPPIPSYVGEGEFSNSRFHKAPSLLVGEGWGGGCERLTRKFGCASDVARILPLIYHSLDRVAG